ncbi:MAG TPA: MFS transporter [Ktedonobacteraceae bacterium]|jgi:MFS family permease|nr:MFS transporter [Ktedonobacteraceae bacterium]
MLSVIRQRNFGLLWIGQIISMTGDWVLFIALPFYIYILTGSTLATGIMFIVQTLPRLFFGSVAGVFVDRWNRKYTMIIVNLVQALILLSLFLVRSQDLVWIVYLCAFADSLVSQFFNPAQTAIIPMLVEEKDLLAANSLNSMSQELTRLVGPSLGGLLFGLLGIGSVITVDLISFLFSAALVALIIIPARPVAMKREQRLVGSEGGILKNSLLKVWQEWRAGMGLVKKEQLVRAIFIIIGVAMVGEGIIEVLFAPYVERILHGTPLVLGWLMSAQAVGGILGSLTIPRLSKILRPGRLMAICGLVFSSVIVVIALLPLVPVILSLIIFAGAGAVGFFIPMLTLLQTNVANEYQGRIFGALNAIQAVTLLVGMVLAGGLGDRIGIVPLLLVDAGFNFLATFLALALIRVPFLVAQPSSEIRPGSGLPEPVPESL